MSTTPTFATRRYLLSRIPVVILCGGLGTRLQSVSQGRQKVLVSIADEPFLALLTRYLAEQGLKHFVWAAGFGADAVEKLARDLAPQLGVRIDVVVEPEPLGTGGAIRFAADQFDAERFFVVNGDSLCEFSYEDLRVFHDARTSLFSMALVTAAPGSDGGFVRIEGEQLAGFQEKTYSPAHSFLNAGTYLVERAFLSHIPATGASSLERDILPGRVGGKLYGFPTKSVLHDIGTPDRLEAFRARMKPTERYVFLDRDGVINTYQRNAYVNKPEDFTFIPGTLEALVELERRGIRVIVISNQAGVGKGLMPPENLDAITAKMRQEVETAGGKIWDVFYCTHNTGDGCDCRKPRPGMLRDAAEKHGINLARTTFIGDSETDWQAAVAAGCPFILVLSGKITPAVAASWSETPPVMARDLLEAIDLLD